MTKAQHRDQVAAAVKSFLDSGGTVQPDLPLTTKPQWRGPGDHFKYRRAMRKERLSTVYDET